jgi:hypothetical protein
VSTNRSWSKPVSDSEAARRAAGRRHYNSVRQDRADFRRKEIIKEWTNGEVSGVFDLAEWGGHKRLAEKLGVSQSTLTRDLAAIRHDLGWEMCPTCTGRVPTHRYETLVHQGKIRRSRKKGRVDQVHSQTERDQMLLVDELVIRMGRWDPNARVLAIAEDKGVALVLVDPGGDGRDLLVTCWRLHSGAWFQEVALRVGDLASAVTGIWEDGPMVYAIGRSAPRKAALVRCGGALVVCRPNEHGYWVFARQTDDPERTERPQVIA